MVNQILSFLLRSEIIFFLKVDIKVETSEAPKKKLLDRRINICQIWKTEKKFPKTKEFARKRISVPLSCPLKAGLVEIMIDYRESDLVDILQIILEMKQLSSALTVKNLQNLFNLEISFMTKIKNTFVIIARLNIEDLKMPL